MSASTRAGGRRLGRGGAARGAKARLPTEHPAGLTLHYLFDAIPVGRRA